jgi:hypothetical protein
MKCPICDYQWKNKRQSDGGRRGGSAKVRKGMSNQAVLEKVQSARKIHRISTATEIAVDKNNQGEA